MATPSWQHYLITLVPETQVGGEEQRQEDHVSEVIVIVCAEYMGPLFICPTFYLHMLGNTSVACQLRNTKKNMFMIKHKLFGLKQSMLIP